MTSIIVKILLGFLFGLGGSYGYHSWQLHHLLKHRIIPTKQYVYKGMLQRFLTVGITVAVALALVPEPKLPFLLGMIAGMIGTSFILLSKLRKKIDHG